MKPSIQARFETRCEAAPDSHALAIIGSDGKPHWLSRSTLREEALRIGKVLNQKGLEPGDVCELVLSPDASAHIALLGCLLVGGIPVQVAPPILRGSHSNLRDVIRSVARRADARVIVLDDDVEFDPSGGGSSSLAVVPRSELEDLAVDPARIFLPESDSVAALQLTSGTTGFPRICVWQQDRVLAGLDGMQQAMELGVDDVCVNWTPLYHDMGLVNNFLLCLTAGIPLGVIETMEFLRNPAVWLRALALARATTTWAPNFGFAYTRKRVLDQELEGVRLDGVRAFWNAAERIHPETMESFHERFQSYGVQRNALKTNFGCAENVGGATFSDPRGSFLVEWLDPRSFHEEGVARPVSHDRSDALPVVGVGRPYPGMRIRIVNSEGQRLPDGHIGRILFDTPSRMSGYLADEEASSEALQSDWLFSGDLGYLRGPELFWTGRAREQINLRGRKYDPSDFEKVLFSISGVRQGCFAAFGVDDGDLGTQRLVILTEIREDGEATTDRLLEVIREQILIQMGVVADEIYLLPRGTMTKTSSGKRRHRLYHQLYLQGDIRPLNSWGAKSQLAIK